ncbi:nad dependent epimerase [Diplodia corticola]|uniref:Nad dependent epimerase n=1 Tax=Diplodia corticola TaxID=236234 RepID=A0A1J9QWB0_9PEZI|nr:nad dependent epimerase [Diplodia corticola]OJD32673.1 nad dependent epimerase [Diplodia corticola]
MCIFCPPPLDDFEDVTTAHSNPQWPTTPRLIDRLPDPPHPQEMQLLILGLPRTGLVSLRHALTHLGYNPFSAATLSATPSLYAYWEEALRAKYLDDGAPFGAREYAKLLAAHDACIDAPASLLASDLIAAYPRAKVVLTTCDADAWARYTLHHHQMVDSSLDSRGWGSAWNPFAAGGAWEKWRRFERFLRPLLAPRGEKDAFCRHEDEILRLVPEDRLLVYSVAEGWGPLCEFLGREVPDVPFPHVGDGGAGEEGSDEYVLERWWRGVGSAVRRAVLPSVGAVVGSAAWWLRGGSSWVFFH